MALSLNTSDPLYGNICMCIMVQSDGSAVVDVANPTVTFTRNASGTTNVISSGPYGLGFGLDGSGSFTSWGWTAANIPTTLGPAAIAGLPGNSAHNSSSVFVGFNAFISAGGHSPVMDCSVATNKPGVSSGDDSLYIATSGSSVLTGTQALPTTSQFTMMTTWLYGGGAGGAQIFFNGAATPDVTGSSTATGSTGCNISTLGPTNGQGSMRASLFCIVIFDTIVSGSDFQRLTNSLSGSGAFALVASSGGAGGGGTPFLPFSRTQFFVEDRVIQF